VNNSLIDSWVGGSSLVIFIVAYLFVMVEEHTKLRKSKPVLLAAGLIWLVTAIGIHGTPAAEELHDHFRHNLLEYAEILLFLMVAMSYINVLEERQVFAALRSRLVRGGWSYRKLFWLTGTLAFFISPVADNMTTALLMGAVVVAVGGTYSKFIALSCINVVVAANAGGAFSPFGDITTLMVWQKGVVKFSEFFALFVPSLVVWLVPALLMSRFISTERTTAGIDEKVVIMRLGARRMMFLFLCTIITAVLGHNFFHLPPVYGMLFGLGYMKLMGYYLKIKSAQDSPFDVMHHVQRIEWDTLLFFYGVIMCVGALGYIGYLSVLSQFAYGELNHTVANIGVGILSAVIDNIPIMFAVLSMNPDMSHGQWLLVTLTAGVGGSLLSIGSAAGVALMGAAKGHYTFFSHLRWTPAIALGYGAGIAVHMVLNASLF
jgi:NhaD family Na+/H+ antiporter